MNLANDSIDTPSGPLIDVSSAIKSLRDRSRELLRLQANRLRELETKLEQQLVAAIERLEQEPREIGSDEQQLFDRAASLEREVKHLQQLRRESEQALEEARLMLGEMEEERRILRDRLDEAENRSPGSAPAPQATDDSERLHRRLEMA